MSQLDWFGRYAGGFGDYVLEVGLPGGRALEKYYNIISFGASGSWMRTGSMA